MLSDLLKTIDELTTNQPNRVKLTVTTKLKNIEDEEAKNFLKSLYASSNPTKKILGSVFNSIITQKRFAFLLTKNILSELVESDPNLKRNTINTQAWNEVVAALLDPQNAILERIKEPTAGRGGLPGVYLVVNFDLKSLISRLATKNLEALHKQQALDLYDEYEQKSSEKSQLKVLRVGENRIEEARGGKKDKEHVFVNKTPAPLKEETGIQTTLPEDCPYDGDQLFTLSSACTSFLNGIKKQFGADAIKQFQGRQNRVKTIKNILAHIEASKIDLIDPELISQFVQTGVSEIIFKNKENSANATLLEEINDAVQSQVASRWFKSGDIV